MAAIRLENITKHFESKQSVISDLSLNINDGEFLVLVGPSGCGKSTTLRIIAGLETANLGNIYIDDKNVNNVAPKDRDIAMVFQNYALYPHMTVFENMAFGLKLRKYSKAEIDRRVSEAAEILEISDLLDRKPKQLSGGQCQRVALGRAIVRKPKVFLFDEPLSNLDAKLRVQMRSEIKRLHKHLDTTMIYVTHDQVEAMTMGDRIVIMKDGIIHQIGTPFDIYHSPSDMFVAGFIGSPAMNFILGKFLENGDFIIQSSNKTIPNLVETNERIDSLQNKEMILGIRPEDLEIEPNFTKNCPLNANIELIEPLGHEVILHLKCDDLNLLSISKSTTNAIKPGDHSFYINRKKIHLFDAWKKKGYN